MQGQRKIKRRAFLLLTAYLHKWLGEKQSKKVKLKLFKTLKIWPEYVNNYARFNIEDWNKTK